MTKELLLEARIAELMPLFIEARDALPAISMVSAKFHNLDLTLGARMDSVGTKDWRAAIAQPVPQAVHSCANGFSQHPGCCEVWCGDDRMCPKAAYVRGSMSQVPEAQSVPQDKTENKT